SRSTPGRPSAVPGGGGAPAGRSVATSPPSAASVGRVGRYFSGGITSAAAAEGRSGVPVTQEATVSSQVPPPSSAGAGVPGAPGAPGAPGTAGRSRSASMASAGSSADGAPAAGRPGRPSASPFPSRSTPGRPSGVPGGGGAPAGRSVA